MMRKAFASQLYRRLSSQLLNNCTMDYRQRKEVPLKHLFDGSELNVYDTQIINLSAGTPSENLLKECCENFKIATDHRMKYESENNSYLFQYGPTVGSFLFRTKLSEFLSRGYKSKVDAADLVLTAGATNGIHLILSSLVDLHGMVFLDEVTYMIALEAIKQFSTIEIVPVKLNEDGVDINDLEEKLMKNRFQQNSKMFWGVYYTIPTFHNPTGILFSEDVQKSLIKLARKYEILIACDDVYNLLPFEDETPPKRLFAYDNFDDEDFKGNVISNGTFSKLLSPGVRIGWMECAPRIVEKFRTAGVLLSGGAINNYTSGVVCSLIELGLADQQLDRCLQSYKAQCSALCEALDEHLPSTCTFIKPKGGYFIWIKLPETCDGDVLSAHCLENFKVFAIRGSRFSIENKFKNYIRLSFAFHPPDTLREAGKKLCDGIKDYLSAN